MNEELLAELAAFRRLINRLDAEMERLKRQFDVVEKTAQQGRRQWRGRDDEDDGSD